MPDAVHQMRVSARRLRSGLKVFAPLLDAAWADRLRAELGWMASSLGQARDTEVLQERLDRHARQLDAGDDVLAAAVVDEALTAQMAQAQGEALRAVDSERYVSLLEDLVVGVRRPPLTPAADAPAGKALPRLVATAFRRLSRRVDALEMDSPSPQWHEARIAAKRARYAADAVAPVMGPAMADLAERLADTTEVLGSHQDAHVAQHALRAMVGAGTGPTEAAPPTRRATPAESFALGRLLALEEAAELADREAFLSLWPAVRKAARKAGVA
jgi:CHAD domain-containing protein